MVLYKCQKEEDNNTLSPSATSQIFSPVAGLKVGKVFPLTEFFHSLLIKICEKTTFLQMNISTQARREEWVSKGKLPRGLGPGLKKSCQNI